MNSTDLQKKKKEFAKLWIEQMHTQRHIAEKLGVSEVTASKWANLLKSDSKQLKKIYRKLLNRIEFAINDENSTSTVIHNLTTSLSVISKQLENVNLYE
jgi:ribosomal protein L20